MGDYFFNNLPVGHAIRTLSLAAATTSLGTEPAVAGAVGPTVDDARRRFAAVSWLLGDDYSKAAVLALPAASRNYLLKLLGLPYAPRTANARQIVSQITVPRTTQTWMAARQATAKAAAALAAVSRGTTPADLLRPSYIRRKWQHSWPSREARSRNCWMPPACHTTRPTPTPTCEPSAQPRHGPRKRSAPQGTSVH
jgi:hypothetical protein